MGAVAETQDAPQHLTALESANKVRFARAELKRRIKRGDTSVPDVLAAVPAEVSNMPVMELLMAPKRWGRERSRRVLMAAGNGRPISELKPVGELTERQREAISALVQPARRR